MGILDFQIGDSRKVGVLKRKNGRLTSVLEKGPKVSTKWVLRALRGPSIFEVYLPKRIMSFISGPHEQEFWHTSGEMFFFDEIPSGKLT